MDSATNRTYKYDEALDVHGKTTKFNNINIKREILDGNPVVIYYLPNNAGNIQYGFNSTIGFFISDIGITKNLFRLKDSGVFYYGVSGSKYTSDNRPNVTEVGTMTFDSTLGKPIWWNGDAWVDATGSVV